MNDSIFGKMPTFNEIKEQKEGKPLSEFIKGVDTSDIYGGNNRWMGQFMNDLPENVFLNKVTTGSGGTTLALRSHKPYVICVPFNPLIKNKMKWAQDNDVTLQYLNGEISISELDIKKGNRFIVTYDSLGKLTEALGKRVNSFNILIDESHKLIDSGAFRGDAIRTVLSNFRKYRAFTFMTATPVDNRFQLDELKQIPQRKIVWEDLEEVKVNYIKLNKPEEGRNVTVDAIVSIALDHLRGKTKGNAHIFVNSINEILKVVNKLRLANKVTSEDVAIVVANNDKNDRKVTDRLGSSYYISDVGDVSKLNFYTSTAFEGCDIEDSTAISYVVVNGGLNHTKIDILITLPQIIGRVRDAKKKNEITLLYAPNRYYSFKNEADFEKDVNKELEKAKNIRNAYLNLDKEIADTLLKGAEFNNYLLVKGGRMLINETAKKYEMWSFESQHKTYSVFKDLGGVITQNDIDYNYKASLLDVKLTATKKLKLGRVGNFRLLFLEYVEAKSDIKLSKNIEVAKDTIYTIDTLKPLVKQAYSILGATRVNSLKFIQKDIEVALGVVNDIQSNDWRIVNLLNLTKGSFVSSKDAKIKIKNAYNVLNIKSVAKGSDLKKYYEVVKTKIRVGGKQVSGVTIIRPKMKIKQH